MPPMEYKEQSETCHQQRQPGTDRSTTYFQNVLPGIVHVLWQCIHHLQHSQVFRQDPNNRIEAETLGNPFVDYLRIIEN
jgi:hypothetical protein